MSDIDELDINPFFKALQGKFSSAYERAQEECYLICIPQSDCLHRAMITEKFVGTHILKPSPFFKGQYQTIRSEKQIVSIADDCDYVSTDEGFPTRTKIKIISEELGYNKEYKPYKMLIIARPLDNNVVRTRTLDDSSYSGEFTLKWSVKDCREFLKSFPEFSTPMKEFDQHILKFMKSYILLKDYLHEAAHRLNDITISTSHRCLKTIKERKLSGQKFRDNVTAAVETCLIGSVHQKLYPVVCSKCSQLDTAMLTKCRRLQGLTPDHMGVPKQFACRFTSAVVELAHLDSLTSPIEKLYCLKTTIDNITEDINTNVRASQPLGVADEDIPCLTSDELLPILLTVLIQAKCNHVHSDIYYMENFYWSAACTDKDTLSYCLVTFKAAVQYLMTTDFDDIDIKALGASNEISFQELIQNRRKTSDTNAESPGTSCDTNTESPGTSRRGQSGSYAPSRSRFDRQMDNIAKMLDDSTKDMKQANANSVGRPIVSSIFGGHGVSVSPLPDDSAVNTEQPNKKEEMGDFLSSLQNDMFLSFGKQS